MFSYQVLWYFRYCCWLPLPLFEIKQLCHWINTLCVNLVSERTIQIDQQMKQENQITDKGLIFLLDALKDNRTLTKLDLQVILLTSCTWTIFKKANDCKIGKSTRICWWWVRKQRWNSREVDWIPGKQQEFKISELGGIYTQKDLPCDKIII